MNQEGRYFRVPRRGQAHRRGSSGQFGRRGSTDSYNDSAPKRGRWGLSRGFPRKPNRGGRQDNWTPRLHGLSGNREPLGKERTFGQGEEEGSVSEEWKKQLEARRQERERKKVAKAKTWRLIIRNLPFSTTEEDFRKFFQSKGEVADVTLPTKKLPDGSTQLRGFGFVQYHRFPDAHKARKELNLQKLGGRAVAIDWAAPKDEYLSATLKDTAAVKAKEGGDAEPQEQTTEAIDQSKEETAEAEEDEEKDELVDEDSESNGTDAEEESGEEEGEEGEEEGGKKKKRRWRDMEKEDEKEIKPDSAIEEGRTLFVRNLSFDTTDEDLHEFFEKFGKLKYALVCKYKDTEHSRGTGFLQYHKLEDADKVIVEAFKANQEEGGLKLDGRVVSVMKAMQKSRVKEMEAAKKEKEPKDKRNLHLMRVGLIRAGTEAAAGMSEEDATKRIKIAAANKRKIKDLHIFVSSTRLCVHNIPPTVDDKSLRKLCLNGVSDGSANLKECRIMRDRDRTNASGLGKSRGFAFVEFAEHSHALACLKNLNNNPKIFSDKKRPIVEFSLENMVALNRKKLRAEKAAEMKGDNAASAEGEGGTSPAKAKKRKRLSFKEMRLLKKQKRMESTGGVKADPPDQSGKTTSDQSEGKDEARTFPKKGQKLSDTKKALKAGGLKPLPARLGPKIRHKRKKDAAVPAGKKGMKKGDSTKKGKSGLGKLSRKERRAVKAQKQRKQYM